MMLVAVILFAEEEELSVYQADHGGEVDGQQTNELVVESLCEALLDNIHFHQKSECP